MSEESYISVRQVMTASPRVIDGLAPVSEAIALMRENKVSSLIIDRRHPGDEFGMVIVHDIAEKVIGPDRSPERTSVYEIMTKPVLTVDVAMDIKYAVRLLARFGVSRALVTEHGNMVGIVTLRDMVLRYAAPTPAGS